MALNNDQSLDLNNHNTDKGIDNNTGNSARYVDTEKGTKNRSGQSANDKGVGARIAPVLPHLQNYDFGSDDSGSDILGKQIEMEASSAIQYRTCSWQKARRPQNSNVHCFCEACWPLSAAFSVYVNFFLRLRFIAKSSCQLISTDMDIDRSSTFL